MYSLNRRCLAELIGTSFLLMAVVGSGIMGEKLAGGNLAIALLANSLATGAALVVIIWIFGPISGSHLNPIVTVLEVFEKVLTPIQGFAYIGMQVTGAIVGVWLTHLMFDMEVVVLSQKVRAGFGQTLSEFIATFGLIIVLRGIGHFRKVDLPVAIGLYITAAYWFTSSTSFANPAVTLARAFTPTFAGISIGNVLGFVTAQFAGGIAAELLAKWLFYDGNRKK